MTPSCKDLLDAKIRKQLAMYATYGYIGVVISEAIAYIALLEEEIARREAAENPS
jgi:hypothetical protein